MMALVVGRSHLSSAFLLFGGVLLAAAVINGLFGTETKGQILEEISP
jgi:hypothetical protein